jgi:multidrug efflux system membrane fusion protein
MKRKTIIIVTSIVIAIVALVTVKLVINKRAIDKVNNRPTQTNPPVAVTAVAVKKESISSDLVKTGTLLPYKEADIMSTSAGRVTELNLELGDHVTEGQVIGVIDQKLKQLALEKAELTLSKYKVDYDRDTALLAGNAITETTVYDMKYNYEDTKNQVEQLRKQLSDANISVPISGTVTKKSIQKGEYVNNGTQIGSVVDISKLKMQVLLTETEVNGIKLNQIVKVTPNADTVAINAIVTYISPKGDDSHNYLVELTFANRASGPIKAGGIAYADFSQGSSEKVLQVPRNSLVESVLNPYVYVAIEGRAIKRKIKVGREFGNRLELLDGLNAGDLVITSSQMNLSDSTLISLVNTHN